MTQYDEKFVNTFNDYYPFERYVVKNPKKINNLFDDVILTEIFIPKYELTPLLNEDGSLYSWTKIDTDSIYVKLECKGKEFRMGYFDFASYIREEIRNIIEEEFGGFEWESLYVDYEEKEDLKERLKEQINLIKSKYGSCKIKEGFKMIDTVDLIKEYL